MLEKKIKKRELILEVENLKEELEDKLFPGTGLLTRTEGKFACLLEFFQIVSSFQDKEILDSILFKKRNRKKFKKQLPLIESLLESIYQCGRNPFGMNRTERGELVTEENVYIGGVHGLFTHTVHHWENTLDSRDPDQNETLRILMQQAHEFLNSNKLDVLKKIDNLLESLR